MASCLLGSGSIGRRLLLIRQPTLYAYSNSATCHFSTTGRAAIKLFPRIYRPLQHKSCLSTIPSSLSESDGTTESNPTATPLTPNDQLLSSIEALRPKKKMLANDKAFSRLELLLKYSYTVPQLKKYIQHHNISYSKRNQRKDDLIQRIMEDFWQLTTPERKRTKELLERKNTSQQQFKLEKDELFFVLDNNGSMLRTIEETHDGVRIMINMTGMVGTVEGPKHRLGPALADIRDALVLERQSFKLDTNAPSTAYLNMVPQRVMDDLSKSSGAYIAIANDQISLTAPTTEALDDAKRKLDVFFTDFGLTSKRSLQSSDYIVIQSQPQSTVTAAPLTFVPLHDSSTLPLALKTIGWSRITSNEEIKCDQETQVSNMSQFHLLEGSSTSSTGTLSPFDLKDILKQPLGITDDSNKHISIEATFGHLLFQNPTMIPGQTNLLVPELRDTFDVTSLQKLINSSTSHRRFFSGNPPKTIRPSLVPVASKNDFHRRTVTIEYIESSFLGQLQSDSTPTTPSTTTADWPSPLQRLQLEFIEQDEGVLEFSRALGEHSRSTMDILGLAGNVDIRLTAKEYTPFNRDSNSSNDNISSTTGHACASLLNLAAQCQLTSYSEVMCPSTWNSGSNIMVLVDVAFNNESRYQLDNNLVTLRHIEEQESRTRRTEMKIEPFGLHHGVSNGFSSWDDMWYKIVDLAQRWKYRND